MSLLFLLATFLAASRGAPLTNSTVPTTTRLAPFFPSSILARDLSSHGDDRTTLDIIWACVATIFACTWISVHPNLPSPRESGLQQFRRKVVTMIIAIFAPELIAVWATRQWIGAKVIKKEFNDKFHGGTDPELSLVETFKQWFTGPPAKPRQGWTLTHGFFLQMGGFMIYDEEKLVKVLTFKRLMKAIDSGEIEVPNIPEEDIMDKSKGDFLSKLIVVVQTTWFVIQCIGRWRSNLPLAELEVMTLAFAVLTIFVYGFWWSKPQSVVVPIKLALRTPTRDVAISATCPQPELSSSSLAHPSSSIPDEVESGSNAGSNPNSTVQVTTTRAAGLDGPDNPQFQSAPPLGTRSDSGTPEHDQEKSGKEDVGESYDKQSFHWFRRKFRDASTFKAMTTLKQFLFSLALLPRICFRITQYWFIVAGKTVQNITSKTPFSENSRGKEFIVGRDRVPMFYAEEFEDDYGSVALLFAYLVIPVVFGGLHLTLWSSPFHTSLERLLWRISGLYITTAPLFVMIVWTVLSDIPARYAKLEDIASAVSVFSLVLYPVSRYILFYISVASLFHLPEDVYRDVQWSEFLPHV